MNFRIPILLVIGAAGLAAFWLSRPREASPSFLAPVPSLVPAAVEERTVAAATLGPTTATEPEFDSELFHVTVGGRRFSDPLEAIHFVDTGPAELRLAAVD